MDGFSATHKTRILDWRRKDLKVRHVEVGVKFGEVIRVRARRWRLRRGLMEGATGRRLPELLKLWMYSSIREYFPSPGLRNRHRCSWVEVL